MNTQTVSPATARLLANAGFPQPAPAPGQWWGNGERLIYIFRKWSGEIEEYFTVIEYFANSQPTIDRYFDARDFAGLVYLPTVGDVLRELGIGYDITVIKNGLSVCILREGEAGEGSPEKSWLHKSEHEAAALAWLQLNKNSKFPAAPRIAAFTGNGSYY